jgi:hypothetical protein
MDVLYVQSPSPSPGIDAAQMTLLDTLESVSGVHLTAKTLSEFAAWYPEEAKKVIVPEFDLSIVECSPESLGREIKGYLGKNGPFLRDPGIWWQIVHDGAMGAVLHASLCHRSVVFVCQDGDITQAANQALSLYPHACIKTYADLSDLDLISLLAYRVDSGRPAFPTLTGWIPAGLGELPSDVPPFASSLLAETFSSDDPLKNQYLHWWILSACAHRFAGRYEAVRTLCLAVEYAQRVMGDRLEGTPVLFQAAIVPNTWWEDNRDSASIVIRLSDDDFRISVKRAPQLSRLLHYSNGHSTVFVLSEDGAVKALMDVGTEQGRTRLRLDELRERLDGFIISTDVRQQLWIHGRDKDVPLILANGEWRLELSSGDPMIALGIALSGKWSNAQIERIRAVILRLSDERIGGFLVFHPDPVRAAAELRATPLRDEPGQHLQLPATVDSFSEATLAQILGLDGAQLFDLTGRLCLACQHIALAHEDEEPRDGGTKHATARRVARRFRDAIVTAISHDGPITTFAGGTRYRTYRTPVS